MLTAPAIVCLAPSAPSWPCSGSWQSLLVACLPPSIQSYFVRDGSKTSVYQSPSVSLCSRTKCGIPDALAWPLGASQAAPASFPASLTLGVGGGVVVLQPVGSLSCLPASCTIAFLVDIFLFSGQDELLSALCVITLCLSLGGNTETPLSRLVPISGV